FVVAVVEEMADEGVVGLFGVRGDAHRVLQQRLGDMGGGVFGGVQQGAGEAVAEAVAVRFGPGVAGLGGEVLIGPGGAQQGLGAGLQGGVQVGEVGADRVGVVAVVVGLAQHHRG